MITIDAAKKLARFYVLGAFFIMMLILHRYIFLQGDDFFYGTLTANGPGAFIDKMTEHYYYVNGRTVVHILVCGLLLFGMELFRILGPVLITVAAGTAAFIPGALGQRRNSLFSVITAVCLFSVMSILITNQSIYWLDGCMNYLYPVVLMLLTYYFLRKARVSGKSCAFLPVLAFFAGCSVEQTGTMTVGLLLMDLAYRRLFEKARLTKTEIITFVAALIGYALVVTAPGNFARVGAETSLSMSGIISAAFFPLLNINFLLHPATLYNAVICICSIFWLIKYKNRVNLILAWILGAGLLAYEYFTSVYFLTPYYVITDYFKPSIAMLLFSALNICSLLYTSMLVMKREKEGAPLFFAIIALGAQFMMLFSPVFSYRVLVPTIFSYLVIVAYAICKSEKPLPLLSAISLAIMVYLAPQLRYTVLFAVFLLIINAAAVIIKNLQVIKLMSAVLCAALSIMAFCGIQRNITGYKKNSDAHIYNISATMQYKNSSPPPDKLILKKVPDESYHWSAPYISEYHLLCYKLYYDISDADIEFIEYSDLNSH